MRIVISILLVIVVSLPIFGSDYVRPEQYGAKGDGMHDDSPAFNACLSLGKEVRLHKGKTYRLKSALKPLMNHLLSLNGSGATLVIDPGYPVRKYEQIFSFEDRKSALNAAKVKNLKILCYLPQKFATTE